MFELLVPAEKEQLDRLRGDKKAYDLNPRPQLMVQAIKELQTGGVEPDIWKVEGLDRRADCEAVVAAARRDGRDEVGCIILGRGEDDRKVQEWLKTAAGVPGFIGFAVGRTDFWEPLVNFRAKKITRNAAVAAIAQRYLEFVQIFETSSKSGQKIEKETNYENEISNATWNGGPGSNGREHGATSFKSRPPVRGL
jgi:5-dehydro-2-deoxygluconokinase